MVSSAPEHSRLAMVCVLVSSAFIVACSGEVRRDDDDASGVSALSTGSSSYTGGGEIPDRVTCEDVCAYIEAKGCVTTCPPCEEEWETWFEEYGCSVEFMEQYLACNLRNAASTGRCVGACPEMAEEIAFCFDARASDKCKTLPGSQTKDEPCPDEPPR